MAGYAGKLCLSKIGNMSVDQITSPIVRDLLLDIWLEIPETARRVRQRIGAVIDWSVGGAS
jgi:hypothetical protein